MAVNLKKIARDIQNSDEDIRILALSTISQFLPASIDNLKDLDNLCTVLEGLSQDKNSDVVFLSRKAINHLKGIRVKLPGGAPAPGSAAQEKEKPVRPKEELIFILERETDPNAISLAIRELGLFGEKEHLGLILKFLSHADARVRGNAVEALESLDDTKTITEVLSPMLHDENNRVRGNVVKVLGKIGYPRVLEILRDMIASPTLSMQESAVWALSYIKGNEMVDLLIKCLKHQYEGIRLRAAQGLGRHRDLKAVSSLQQCLNDVDASVVEEAQKAIALITDGKPDQNGIIDISSVNPDGTEATAADKEKAGSPLEPPPVMSVKAEDLQSAAAAIMSAPKKFKLPDLSKSTPDELKKMLQEQLKILGEHIQGLLKKNKLSCEELNKPYYDLLKYQEFLKKHQEKEAEKEKSGGFFSAISQMKLNPFAKAGPMQRLEEQIVQAFRDLGKKAIQLARGQQVKFDQDDYFLALISEIEKKLGGSA